MGSESTTIAHAERIASLEVEVRSTKATVEKMDGKLDAIIAEQVARKERDAVNTRYRNSGAWAASAIIGYAATKADIIYAWVSHR